MSIYKFLDKTPIGWLVKRQERIMEATNPEAIDVALIAKFFFIPKFIARFFCNLAVREGTFKANPDGTYTLIENETNK